MNNNYYPLQQMRPSYSNTLKGRPVSSIDEARAAPIDFDGSVTYFPDVANKRIYSKQINMDGTATMCMYELKPLPVEAPSANYVTKEELEKAINDLRAALTAQPKVEKKDLEPSGTPARAFNF